MTQVIFPTFVNRMAMKLLSKTQGQLLLVYVLENDSALSNFYSTYIAIRTHMSIFLRSYTIIYMCICVSFYMCIAVIIFFALKLFFSRLNTKLIAKFFLDCNFFAFLSRSQFHPASLLQYIVYNRYEHAQKKQLHGCIFSCINQNLIWTVLFYVNYLSFFK